MLKKAELVSGYAAFSQWRIDRPALLNSDSHDSSHFLPYLLALEIKEALMERESLVGQDQHLLDMEMIDTLVVLFGFFQATQTHPDFSDVLSRVNGTGKTSSVFDKTHDMALNLADGNVSRNAHAVLINLLSILNHLPNEVDVKGTMQDVVTKNTMNRPSVYFTNTDIQGHVLSRDELLQKYRHVTKMLRALRDHFNLPLEDWMHEPFAHLIMDFRSSDQNLHRLYEELALITEQSARQTLLTIRSIDGHVQPDKNQHSSHLAYGLLAAGAIPVGAM